MPVPSLLSLFLLSGPSSRMPPCHQRSRPFHHMQGTCTGRSGASGSALESLTPVPEKWSRWEGYLGVGQQRLTAVRLKSEAGGVMVASPAAGFPLSFPLERSAGRESCRGCLHARRVDCAKTAVGNEDARGRACAVAEFSWVGGGEPGVLLHVPFGEFCGLGFRPCVLGKQDFFSTTRSLDVSFPPKPHFLSP